MRTYPNQSVHNTHKVSEHGIPGIAGMSWSVLICPDLAEIVRFGQSREIWGVGQIGMSGQLVSCTDLSKPVRVCPGLSCWSGKPTDPEGYNGLGE